MSSLRIVALFSFLLFAPLGQASDNPKLAGVLETVDAYAAAVQAYEQVPGMSVGIVVDQDLVFQKGYGYSNVRRKVPADENTIYSICSISKLFTSIGVMQQRDAGRLNLRDPVKQHLPWLPTEEKHAEFGPANVLSLLTHSSGFMREVDIDYWGAEGFPFPDRETMLKRLATQSTLYPANERFQYSNLALTLAGEVLAATSGEPYLDYVSKRIIEPLGMADTRPYFPKELHGKQMAIGYTGKFRDRKRKKIPPFDAKALAPAFGFTSSVADLATFASWQFRTLAGKDDSGVLDRNTLREMHRVHWVDPDWKTTWGIGFVASNANGTTAVGHGGGCPGYITAFQLVPSKKVAAIVLTNAADGPAGTVANNILKVLGKNLGGKKTKADDDTATVSLADYAGDFGGSVWGGETAIRVWDDQLVALGLPARNFDNLAKLKHVEADKFIRVNDNGEELEPWEFLRNEAGKVYAVKRHSQQSFKI